MEAISSIVDQSGYFKLLSGAWTYNPILFVDA